MLLFLSHFCWIILLKLRMYAFKGMQYSTYAHLVMLFYVSKVSCQVQPASLSLLYEVHLDSVELSKCLCYYFFTWLCHGRDYTYVP